MPDPSASSDLIAAVYWSRPTERLSAQALTEMLMLARRRNAVDGITGRLVVADGEGGLYLQYIEGPDDAVNACLDRILLDPRHQDAQVAAIRPIARRRYPEWEMDLQTAAEGSEPDVLRAMVEGLARFDRGGLPFSLLPPARPPATDD